MHPIRKMTYSRSIWTRWWTLIKCHSIIEKTVGISQAIKQMGKKSYRCLSRHQRTYLALMISIWQKLSLYTVIQCFWRPRVVFRLSSLLFERMTKNPIKGEGKHMHGNWKRGKIFMVKMFYMTFIAIEN